MFLSLNSFAFVICRHEIQLNIFMNLFRIFRGIKCSKFSITPLYYSLVRLKSPVSRRMFAAILLYNFTEFVANPYPVASSHLNKKTNSQHARSQNSFKMKTLNDAVETINSLVCFAFCWVVDVSFASNAHSLTHIGRDTATHFNWKIANGPLAI